MRGRAVSDFLTDAEIRSLPSVVIGSLFKCPACGATDRLAERAHIRKQDGPRILLCRECLHDKLHHSPRHFGIDVTRDGRILWREGDEWYYMCDVPPGIVESRPDVFDVLESKET